MPAAAVIPAPIAYIKVVAVKKLVVGFLPRTIAVVGISICIGISSVLHRVSVSHRYLNSGWQHHGYLIDTLAVVCSCVGISSVPERWLAGVQLSHRYPNNCWQLYRYLVGALNGGRQRYRYPMGARSIGRKVEV